MTETKQTFELKQVATQTSNVVYNSKEDNAMSIEEAIVEILNRLEAIEKKL